MAGCGGDDPATGAGAHGAERTVLVDYQHDQFASSFVQFYPKQVAVHPGDTVTFRQTWTGEPHSVTMGTLVDDLFEVAPKVEQYDSPEDARAGGLDEATIAQAVAVFSKVPSMTAEGFTIFQGGAEPCFVEDEADVPEFSPGGESPDPKAKCPTLGKAQPAFTGRQALYNSGFIPYQGAKGNSFELPIAADAKPGTYHYFCNYHWVGMSGTVEVVAKDADIPSGQAVRLQAQKEIAADAKAAIGKVRAVKAGDFGKVHPPLAGLDTGVEDSFTSVDEFFPATYKAKVGEPVTWTLEGWTHTVSFNVPKYFPIFTIGGGGQVRWDPKSYEPVAWKVPPAPEGGPDAPPQPRQVDVGEWNGGGGFHSSGLLIPGDTFTVTFTRPGTYPYACVLHPKMVGVVDVKA
jgi:plastocyanin